MKNNIYQSREGVYYGTRYIVPTGRYNHDSILYQEGRQCGNAILFDSRSYVMSDEEFKNNYVPWEDGKK